MKTWYVFPLVLLGCAGAASEPTGGSSALLIYGGNDLRDVACSTNGPTIVNAARSVARLAGPSYTVDSGKCTGFLVAPNGMFLTGSGCVPTATEAANTTVRFGYDAATCNGTSDGSFLDYPAPTFIHTDATRAYTLLQLCGHPANLFGHLTLGFAPVESNPAIAIIHHPDGGLKKVSLLDDQSPTGKCKVYPGAFTLTPPGHFFESAFGYKCDTTWGAVGAPVVSPSTGAVLGLHFDGGDTTPPTDINLATRAVFIKNVVAPFLAGHPPVACSNEAGNPDASCRNHCGETRPLGCRCDAECATRPTPDCCSDKVVWCGRG